MKIKLIRVGVEKAELIWKMQVEAFSELYEKYQDTETSPATEPIEKVMARLQQSFTYYYLIEWKENIVGAIRVVDKKEEGKAKRISPIFVMKPYRNQGIAQEAIEEAERIHGNENWELDTILEEKGNCYLYEKLGYQKTGKIEKINDRLTLVFYKK
ncbi:MAG: GNAT family N-acetyltransferase [Lachnospiraceae bacterium]|nr:GNAT family N-acetyltransferase [Lachnospiraceae bacterium]